MHAMDRCLLGCLLCVLSILGTPRQGVSETPAERGYRLLRTKAYQHGELSAAMFDELWRVWPEPDRARAESADPAARKEMAFRRYGIVPPAADDPFLTRQDALGYVRTDDGWLVSNCLMCHGGKVEGRPIPGLGNSHIALQTLSDDMLRYRRRKGESVFFGALANLYTPLGASNGATNAQIFSVALAMVRDDDLRRVAPKRLPRLAHHDLDAPPLWNTHKKKRLYIDGFVEKTPRVIMQFVLTAGNSGETIKGWESDFEAILAWIESLRPPRYPHPIDRVLAGSGEKIFSRACARCHGTYGEHPHYPEKMVDISEIGTDPLRLQAMPVEHRRFFQTSWFGEGGVRAVIERPEGYVAPPLDGIWASAPYLHNGSVPTLWHLLHADQRPVVWRRTQDGYDRRRVGLEIEEFKELPESAVRPEQKRTYFSTRLPGKSAGGHEFPEALSEDEKTALLEYLKTL